MRVDVTSFPEDGTRTFLFPSGLGAADASEAQSIPAQPVGDPLPVSEKLNNTSTLLSIITSLMFLFRSV